MTRAHSVSDNLVLMEEMFNGKLTVPEIRNLLPQVFPELDPVQGPFAQLGMHDERTRSLSAMLSIVWLHLDVYDSFTAKHVQSSALTRERWTEMQDFMAWVGMSQNSFSRVMVFLIRESGSVVLALSRKM